MVWDAETAWLVATKIIVGLGKLRKRSMQAFRYVVQPAHPKGESVIFLSES